MTSDLSLRPAEHADCRLLFEWANDPLTRSMSFSTDPVDWPTHQRWFASRLADPDCLLYIACKSDGEPLGQVRLDLQGDRAVVSLAVAPLHRRQGHAVPILRLAIETASGARVIRELVAFIRPENAASVRTFAAAGFGAPVPVTAGDRPALRMALVLG